ncbi:hypothetical protein [Nitrospirillum amazonense]|uniref:hypothetical protein n=1 Tax=Nitrospirillum amazonense TaxID=28077 RepID=UPI002412D9C9|nr:hypothetical protein [Nitrospirillum amazonense]MDG3444666.1 hypothetical protein [Nitrospirillum amazonense]
MAYRYETDRGTLMNRILQAAYQDRSSLAASLRSDHQPTPDDLAYAAECDQICRDIMRMDQNLKMGIFHPEAARRALRSKT